MSVSEEVVIKLKTEVDDSAYSSFMKSVQDTKKNAIKFSPVYQEKDLKKLTKESQKTYLENAASNTDVTKMFAISKDRATELLAKLLEVEKQEKESLDSIADNSKADKVKKEVDGDGVLGALTKGGFLKALVKAVTFSIDAAKQISEAYTDKTQRELGIAESAFSLSVSPKEVARLGFAAKNVGLSFEQIQKSASAFATSIFEGTNDQRSAVIGTYSGGKPFDLIRNASTLTDVLKAQINLFQKTREGMVKSGVSELLASSKAAEISGIPAGNLLGYTNLFSKRNLGDAGAVYKERGELGSTNKLLQNFQETSTANMRMQAAMDRLLSVGDVAKTITMTNANVRVGVMHVSADTIESFKDTGSKPNKAAEARETYFREFNPMGAPRMPSYSSQIKAAN